MNELRIKAALAWLQELEDDEYAMRETINTDHPKFKGSEDEEDWKMHDTNIMHIQLVRNLILGATPEPSDSTVIVGTAK
jgi:hypothetical protein